MKNFNNKKPIELTEEETYELVNQIAKIEYSRNNFAKIYQDAEDGTIEFLTYALEKDTRGKKGLNNYYRQLSMSHFKNIVHMEIRNGINYQLRKIGFQKTVLECDSLDKTLYSNNDITSLGDTIINDKELNQVEESLELNAILSRIKNPDNDSIYMKVKYGEEEIIQPFNYKNLTKFYYDFSNNNKLNNNTFKGILFDSSTNEELDEDKIDKVIKQYKKYMIKNKILGGATC